MNTDNIKKEFSEFIKGSKFPCVGGKVSLSKGGITIFSEYGYTSSYNLKKIIFIY